MLAPGSDDSKVRPDHRLIAEMVSEGARVVDVGCGDGQLLRLLTETKSIHGRGVEISREGVNLCVAQGLSVIQGDADEDLINYPDDAFDYAILSQTIQATRQPRHVLEQLLRIARRAIVSFPNFGHWRVRSELFFLGRMPVTGSLPDSWHETPNIHLCTIKDFTNLCDDVDANVERSLTLGPAGRSVARGVPLALQNLLGVQAIFFLSRKPHSRSDD